MKTNALSTTDEDRPSYRYPQIGDEPFNLSPQEIEEAWQQSTLPRTEKETRDCFEKIAGPAFELFPEVRIKPLYSRPIRIDYVGIDRTGRIPGPIGFELKSPQKASENYNDFVEAVAQAIDYSKGPIITPIAGHPELHNQPLVWDFMFPCPYRIYEARNRETPITQRDWWTQGVLKAASKFGVGAVFYDAARHDWGCFLGGHPAFWMKTGPEYLATRHAKRQQIGSGR